MTPNTPKETFEWTGPLLISTVAIVATIGVAVAAIPSVFSAATSPDGEEHSDAFLADLLVAHTETAQSDRNRFLGRSPFFVPRRPPTRPVTQPPAREPVPLDEPETTPQPPAGPPATYQGPKPTSLLGEAVFFRSKEAWIFVGDEESGISVLAIKDPWTVVLGYSGGEYDVGLWGDRNDDFFTVPYDGGVRSSGFVSQPRLPSSSRSAHASRTTPPPPRRPAPPAAENGTPPDQLDQSTINGMSIREAADSMKAIHVLLRGEDLEPERTEALTDTLERLRARLRGGSN